MTTLTLELPEKVFLARRLPLDDFVQDIRLAAAIYLYQNDFSPALTFIVHL